MEFIAGTISGLCQILVGHPLDTYKIWLQTNKKNRNIRNLYHGIKYPLYTNCILNGFLFGLNYNFYQITKNHWTSGFLTGILTGIISGPMELYKIRKQNSLPYLNNWRLGMPITIVRETLACSIYFGSFDHFRDNFSIFYAGGIAGLLAWAIPHPVDTIKTRIQSGSNITFTKALYQGNLYQGIGITCIRAFIVNCVGFPVYYYIFNNSYIYDS